MDETVRNDLPEESNSLHDAPQNTWTDEDTEEEVGTWEDVVNDEHDDSLPTELSGDLEEPECFRERRESGGMALDGRKWSYVDSARMFKLRKGLDQLDGFYKQKELNVIRAREELKACRLHVSELERERDSLESDIERQKQAENSAAVFRLHARHKCVCTELQAEEELEAHLAMVLQEHELELFQVEVELGQFLALRQELEEEEKDFQAQKQEKYNPRIQREKNFAKAAKIKALRAKKEQQKAWQEQAGLEQRKQDQARRSHQKAAVFLKQTLERMHQEEQEKEEKRNELMKRRMEAAAALKASIAKNQEAMQMRQVKEKARLQKQKEDDKCQILSLEAAGMNSIKLMHQHKAQKERNRKQKEFQERQKARRMEILSKLVLEEEQKERTERRHALLFPPSPPHVTQSMVLKQRELRLLKNLLPPSAPAERELVRERCPTRPASSPDSSKSGIGSSLDSMGERNRQGYGEKACEEVDEAMKGDSRREFLVQPEFPGLWDRKHTCFQSLPDEDVPPRTSLLRSTKTGLDKAVTSKTARKPPGGKEHKGPPFVSKPEIVLFKDFELGKTYKQKVVLTNVSLATNNCRFVGLSQNLMDFISISFEPTLPMSAGMSCELVAVFMPLVNEDLDGEIHFQSATGPFSVIIKCRTKKCEMVVDSSFIDFGMHVVGQTISRVITLTNRGALGTRYSLVPLSSSHPQLFHVSQHSSLNRQGSGHSSGMKDAALAPQEETPAERVNIESKSGTSPTRCDVPADVEASGADQVSGDTGLQEFMVTEQDYSSEITEISIGEVHEGEVGPFASVKLPIIFTPTIPGETKLDVQITFSELGCEAIVVSAHGVAESVPVWVTKPSMDLKICMYDCLYQDRIEVQSRASTALKVSFEVCKELKNHIDILPKTGYIQAKSTFHAHLKFLPRSSLPEDGKSFFDRDTGVLEVNLSVQVADQVKPVIFTVHAIVTTSDLKFDCTDVDFGHCSVFESVHTSVRITNCSLLPQDFGFVGIPKFIDVQPNDGFGTLLPLQTLEIDLIFSATKNGEYNFQLTCKTGINRDFLLSCHAIAVRPLLELSDSLVQFGATPVGDHSTAVFYVLNSHTSHKELTHPVPRIGKGPIAAVGPRFFAFVPPENSEITLTPSTGQVLPGQRCLVQVTFSPELSNDDIKVEAARLLRHNEEVCLQESLKAECQEANSGKRMESEATNKKEIQQDTKKVKKSSLKRSSDKPALKEMANKVPLTSKSNSPLQPLNTPDIQNSSDDYAAGKASLLRSFKDRFNHYVIPCFVSNGDISGQNETEEPIYSPYNTLYLELHCPAVRPVLLVVSDNGETTINFKQVAVGQKVLKKVTIQNISSEVLMLKSSFLDPNGPFALLNAMRAIHPGNTHTLVLAFTPTSGKKYHEILEVICSKMSLEFTLCGEGTEPLVNCTHEGHLMDFGYILQKESNSKVFQLHNSSSLSVQFSVLLDSLLNHNYTSLLLPFLSSSSTPCPTLGTQNYSGKSVFSVSPTEGTLEPGKSQYITVTFQPDHESSHYRDTLRVQLMTQHTVCVLELLGAARCHTMFVCGGDQLDLSAESLIPSHIYSATKAEHTEREKLPTPMLLTLRSVYREGRVAAAVRELEVGCIQSSQPAIKQNGEFVWQNLTVLQDNGFSVDPPKGSVDAGHRCTTTLTWTPPAGHTPNKVVQVCVPLILRGDETEVYSVTLLAYTSHHTDSG